MRDFLADVDIPEGTGRRFNCPTCGGNNTLSITKQNGVLLYQCYRVACKNRGAHTQGLTGAEIQAILSQRNSTPAPKETPRMDMPIHFAYDSQDPKMKQFMQRWELQGTTVYYDIVEQRAVFPLYDTTGVMVDAVGRSLKGATPKWKRYTGNGHYYTAGTGRVCVVVEDCISAIIAAKCCKNATVLALLGTTLTKHHRDFLSNYKDIVIALDPDAWHKTIQFVTELRMEDHDAVALLLHDDVKYKHYDDIARLKGLTE